MTQGSDNLPGPYCFRFLFSSLVPVHGRNFDSTRWPTIGDLHREGVVATLRLSYSKTRQAADGGFVVPMRAAAGPPCPVALAQELLVRATRLRLPLSTPLFAALGEGRSTTLRSFTQTFVRGCLKRCLGMLGLPHHAYSFHSFRRGGCSFAFEGGAVEADLAHHGDWRSSAIKSYYPASVSRDRVGVVLARGEPLPPT